MKRAACLRSISFDTLMAVLRVRALVLGVLLGGSVGASALLAFGPGDPALALDGAVAILLLEGAGLTLLLTEGIVARDVRRGWVVLWLQKPVSPVGFYASRFLRALLLLAALIVATGGAVAVLFQVGRGDGGPVLEILPVTLLLSGTLATLTFALSSWRAHPDVVMALAFVFLSTPLSAMATVNPAGFGPAGPFLRALAPPVDAILATGGVWMDGPTPSAQDVAHVLGYLAAWIAVAVVGLLRTTRAPFPSAR